MAYPEMLLDAWFVTYMNSFAAGGGGEDGGTGTPPPHAANQLAEKAASVIFNIRVIGTTRELCASVAAFDGTANLHAQYMQEGSCIGCYGGHHRCEID